MSEYIIRPPEKVGSSLDLQPIIVGEIVRCRDCAFFVADVSTVDESGSVIATDNLCEWTELWVEPNDFCAWAEREEGGDE